MADITFKARPTVYNGIRMRSRLEAGYAAWLDRHSFEWEYEPCAFSDDTGRQYLPDFRLNNVRVSWSDEPRTVYVEVKPDIDFDIENLRMEVILASEPDALLMLAQPPVGVQTEQWWLSTSLLEPDACVKCFWPYAYLWVKGPSGLTLANAVLNRDGPWYGEWWKGVT